ADLQEALTLVDTVPAGPLQTGARAEVEILTAELNAGQHQRPRIEGLDQALKFFAAVEPSFVPRLYLGLARAHLAGGAADQAEIAFTKGISQLEHQQSRLEDDAFKISYFDESWSLYPEMITFQIDVRRDRARAFEYAERSRARSLLAGSRPTTLEELQRAIPDGVAVVYYVTVADRLLTWIVTKSDARLSEARIARDELARLITRYRAPLSDERAADPATEKQM